MMPSLVQPYKILLTFFVPSLLNGGPWFAHSKFSYIRILLTLWQYSGDSSQWSRFQGPKEDSRDCSQQTILQCPGKYCFLKVVLGNIPLKHMIKQMRPRVFTYFSLWHLWTILFLASYQLIRVKLRKLKSKHWQSMCHLAKKYCRTVLFQYISH